MKTTDTPAPETSAPALAPLKPVVPVISIPAKQKSPLLASINALENEGAALAQGIAGQAERMKTISSLQTSRETTRDDVDAERMDFARGSAKITELNGQLDLLDHQKCRRAPELHAAFHEMRSRALGLKVAVIAGIDAAQRAIIKLRQDEVVGLMSSWGGRGGSTLEITPPTAAVLATACPNLIRLEGYRAEILQTRVETGLARLVAVLRPIAEDLASLPAQEKGPAIIGEYTEHDRTSLLGWRDDERRFESIASFAESGPARDHYAGLMERAGFLGFSKIIRFTGGRADNEFSYTAGKCWEVDRHNNAAAVSAGTGSCEQFLNAASAWLA